MKCARQSVRLALALAFVAAALPAVAHAGDAKLPSLPGNEAAPAAVDAGAPDARKALVTVEHDGHASGVGTVLFNDGRILTALSAVGGAEQVDVRYADNHVVKAKVGHRDKAWDLALLVPLTGRWTDGLPASDNPDPSGESVKAFVAGARSAPVAAKVKGRVEAHAKEGDILVNALDVDMRTPSSAGVGAPLVDAKGTVVGIVVHVCKALPGQSAGNAAPPVQGAPPPPCTGAFYGAPIPAIKSFLFRTPATAAAPPPWLGIQGESGTSGNTRGVRVTNVAPGSPADKAGLKASTHLIVAVDGRPVDSPEKLGELIAKHGIGDSVKLLILDGDRLREVQVVLRASPQ